jgi:hypothetical protein
MSFSLLGEPVDAVAFAAERLRSVARAACKDVVSKKP